MKKVFVYWNLHKHCWSVRDCKTRKVILHLPELSLSDCVFKVSEAGRQRVLREKRKNVHAGVEGYMAEYYQPKVSRSNYPVYYNPYKQETFTCDGRPVKSAIVVNLHSDKTVTAVGLDFLNAA